MAEESNRTGSGAGSDHETIDPVAIALALGRGGDLDPRAAAYLENQARVAIAQERVLQLQAEDLLRENKLHHWSLIMRHISDVLRVIFEISLSAVALAILVAIGAAVWMAAHDDGLVIEPFSVPPDMAARGITGETVANAMLDKLIAMQNATDSARPAQSYANNWGNDVKVEIPNTGVSIGQLYHYLASWLGHETHIRGEVYRTQNGLAVTARVSGSGGSTVTGSEAGFNDLLQQAAENIYRQTQPYRYGVYLASTAAQQIAANEAMFHHLAEDGSPPDRPWAYVALSTGDEFTDPLSAPGANLKAAALAPGFALPYVNLATEETSLGRGEASLGYVRKGVELLQAGEESGMSERSRAISLKMMQSLLASDEGDLIVSLDYLQAAANLPDYSGNVKAARALSGLIMARLHEPSAARAIWSDLTSRDIGNSRLQADYWMGDWPAAMVEGAAVDDALDSLLKRPLTRTFHDVTEQRQISPYVAVALAMTGDVKKGQALVETTPLDCDPCVLARARIAEGAHDWKGAEYWYAREVAQAPSSPFGYTQWGAMLLHTGRYDAAIAKFKEANEKGPHFADPLEMWGEALIQKNRSDLALPKFEEANRYAPNWGRLHLEWGKALFWSGNKSGAKKQFAQTAVLDLPQTDRADLAAWMKRDE